MLLKGEKYVTFFKVTKMFVCNYPPPPFKKNCASSIF